MTPASDRVSCSSPSLSASSRDCEAKTWPSAVFVRKNNEFFWLWISEPKIQRHILSILHSIWNQKWKSPTPAWTPDDRKTAIWACKEVSSYDGVPRSNVMSIPKSYVKMAGTSGVVIDPKRNFDWPEGVFLAKKGKVLRWQHFLVTLVFVPTHQKLKIRFTNTKIPGYEYTCILRSLMRENQRCPWSHLARGCLRLFRWNHRPPGCPQRCETRLHHRKRMRVELT